MSLQMFLWRGFFSVVFFSAYLDPSDVPPDVIVCACAAAWTKQENFHFKQKSDLGILNSDTGN